METKYIYRKIGRMTYDLKPNIRNTEPNCLGNKSQSHIHTPPYKLHIPYKHFSFLLPKKRTSLERTKPNIMGRRKIEMKVVKDTSCRQVTFSKRRTGLFKKANELATLCGAEVAVVVFSPGGKPFSFGQPNVDSIADRFQNQESKPSGRDKGAVTAQPSKNKKISAAAAAAMAEKLNQQLNEQVKQLQEEKKRGEELDKGIAEGEEAPANIDDLGFEDLKKLKRSLEALREKVKERVGEIEASSTLLMLSKDFRA